MPERRREPRPGAPDRRGFPRPPLWVNLVLLLIGVLAAAGATLHRRQLDRAYRTLVTSDESTPEEIQRLKTDLASIDLTREGLSRELDSRLKYIESQRANRFYISIDSSRRKFILHYGNDVVREAPVQIGPPATVSLPNGRTWTFVPLKGAFAVRGKDDGAAWSIPRWVYLLNKAPIPAERPTIQNGLGRYVVYLPNDYVIHSPPSPDSPLKGPKPGSFMVPEADLRAIWPRINRNTPVFIF